MNLAGLWTAPFPTEPTLAWPEIDPPLLSTDSPSSLFEISDLEGINGPGFPEYSSSNRETPDDRRLSPDHSNQIVIRTRNKPMPRKGHTKSRKGCFNCKRRKVKCQESRPMCENCNKAELTCEYPKTHHQDAIVPSPQLPLQSTPTVFSMQDMRLFHHFMSKAYPHLPVGGDKIWQMEMPAYAHEV
jgi:hypothetical protein